jgi:hypothetical protein
MGGKGFPPVWVREGILAPARGKTLLKSSGTFASAPSHNSCDIALLGSVGVPARSYGPEAHAPLSFTLHFQ